MATLNARVQAALKAFKEPDLIVALNDPDSFGEWDTRRMRYSIFWGLMQNNAYRTVNSWATAFKTQYGLYKYIRNLHNPAARLSEFYETHLMGGRLDPLAGDGKGQPSALPIVTENENLREPLAHLWRQSNWQVNKDIMGLWGAVFGDVFLQVIDDPARGQVTIDVTEPSIVKSIDVDKMGNVKRYVIEEPREHPEKDNQTVTYTEQAVNDGGVIRYRTLLNGKPYAWDGNTELGGEWEETYGFIPMVKIQHRNVGQAWGLSEFHKGLSRFLEADDLASMLDDQIRKGVDPIWLFAGVKKPDSTPKTQQTTATTDRPEPGREEKKAVYGNENASATPLVANVDIAGAIAQISELTDSIRDEYPELQTDIWSASTEITGRALRVRRQPVSAKVAARRANYDDGLMRAQQMALSIGGMRRYEGFASISENSFDEGLLDHSIGDRPIFDVDPMDEIELRQASYKAVQEALAADIPLEFALKQEGFSKEEIDEILASEEMQIRLENMRLPQRMAESFNEGGAAGQGDNQDGEDEGDGGA